MQHSDSKNQNQKANNLDLYFSGNDTRKSKDDFDYLKPAPIDYCFLEDGTMIFSKVMNEQMRYLRGKIPISVMDELFKRAMKRKSQQIFWELVWPRMVAKKKTQQFYT
jgi:hypothetical protein